MAYVKDVYQGKFGVVKVHEHGYEVFGNDGKHVAYIMNLEVAKELADTAPYKPLPSEKK